MKDRFVVGTNEIGEIIVTDVQTDRVYRYDDPSKFFGLIRLLNEQQATNDYLEESNSRLQVQLGETLRLVDEQQATINELKAQLREKEREERLYANEILELRETNKEHIKFKSLGGNY